MRRVVKRWLVATSLVLSLYLGLGESVGQSPFWNQIDKGIHFFLFGIFSFLLVLFAQQTKLIRFPGLTRWVVLILLMTTSCLAGELVHLVVPGRTFEWGDMFANFSGSAVFSAFAALLISPKDLTSEYPASGIGKIITHGSGDFEEDFDSIGLEGKGLSQNENAE